MFKKLETTKSSRRNILRAALGMASILGLGVSAAKAAKVSQSAVGYRNSPNGDKNCANCSLFIAPSSCKSVDGAISPNGWCRIWRG